MCRGIDPTIGYNSAGQHHVTFSTIVTMKKQCGCFPKSLYRKKSEMTIKTFIKITKNTLVLCRSGLTHYHCRSRSSLVHQWISSSIFHHRCCCKFCGYWYFSPLAKWLSTAFIFNALHHHLNVEKHNFIALPSAVFSCGAALATQVVPHLYPSLLVSYGRAYPEVMSIIFPLPFVVLLENTETRIAGETSPGKFLPFTNNIWQNYTI